MTNVETNVPVRQVVLLGVGHTHAEIVRRWRLAPVAGAALTCVSDGPVATYSGMLPGVLAGQYRPEQMRIELAPLCDAAGARLVVGEARDLDLGARTLGVVNHAPLPFDVLSIGIGSVPALFGAQVQRLARLVLTKPMRSFVDRLDAAARGASASRSGPSTRLVIVGGGAGGVELALTAPARVQMASGGAARPETTLLTGPGGLLPGGLNATVVRVRRTLARRGVRVLEGQRVARIDEMHVTLDEGTSVEADLVVWATAATAPPLLPRLGLPTDARGFLLTRDTLVTTSGDPVFAVGDSGTLVDTSPPKAGVHAVRQAPVLWDNIRRTLDGRPLRAYEPQRDFLRLLNTGDGRAIGEWRGVSFEGRWCWRLKDAIDRRFIKRYQDVGTTGRFARPRA